MEFSDRDQFSGSIPALVLKDWGNQGIQDGRAPVSDSNPASNRTSNHHIANCGRVRSSTDEPVLRIL